jgi:hypothetical protein
MNPPEKSENPAAAWAGEILQAEHVENSSEKNWFDFNDVPVTIADQIERVREFWESCVNLSIGQMMRSIWKEKESSTMLKTLLIN